jgi:hypothetical protein
MLMRKLACLPLFILLNFSCFGQECPAFIPDTMTMPGDHKPIDGEYLEAQMKNGSTVRIFRTPDERLFLRLVVTKNFYFNQVSTLEIQSGSKSYYLKNTKQYKIDKGHGLFVAEIFRNYLGTLKELGITALDFGGAVTDFTRQDASAVKKMAQCMYSSLSKNPAK